MLRLAHFSVLWRPFVFPGPLGLCSEFAGALGTCPPSARLHLAVAGFGFRLGSGGSDIGLTWEFGRWSTLPCRRRSFVYIYLLTLAAPTAHTDGPTASIPSPSPAVPSPWRDPISQLSTRSIDEPDLVKTGEPLCVFSFHLSHRKFLVRWTSPDRRPR